MWRRDLRARGRARRCSRRRDRSFSRDDRRGSPRRRRGFVVRGLRVADARALPFPPERFDVVLAITVLCFVPEPEAAAAEMARVLRPGGVLVLGELGRWSAWGAWRAVRGWAGSPTWRAARFWTPRGLRALVRGAGLVPLEARGAAYYPPFGAAAALLERVDPLLRRATPLGAAFVALAARKPSSGPAPPVDRPGRA